MLINNITGTNSLHTNCERDASTSILGDINEFILDCNKEASNYTMHVDEVIEFDPNFQYGPDQEYLDDMIIYDPDLDEEMISTGNSDVLSNENDLVLFDPQFEDETLNYFQDKGLSRTSSLIRQKMIKSTRCDECKTVWLESLFIENCKQILCELKEMVPNICIEHPLKKKLLASIQSTPLGPLGCADHDLEMTQKLKEMCVETAVSYFVDDVNRFLKGKVKVLPINHNYIQKLAFDQFDQKRKKKKVGKYSDIFNP